MTITIPLTRGYSALVDDEDGDLAEFNWYASAGRSGLVYAARTEWVSGKRHYRNMHRVILERVLGIELLRQQLTDHEDRDGLNNRRSNLRLATFSENAINQARRKNNSSGTCGVSWLKARHKWRSSIKLNGKTIYLGEFRNFDAAAATRRDAEFKYFGEFAPRMRQFDGDMAGTENSYDRYLLSEDVKP